MFLDAFQDRDRISGPPSKAQAPGLRTLPRRDLFMVGLVVGDCSSITPEVGEASTHADFAEFMASLARLGVGDHPLVKKLDELHRALHEERVERTRKRGSGTFRNYLRSFIDLEKLIRSVAPRVDFDYFLLGQEVNEVVWTTVLKDQSVLSLIARSTVGRLSTGPPFFNDGLCRIELPVELKQIILKFVKASRRQNT